MSFKVGDRSTEPAVALYEVSVRNTFDATSPEDAVRQMVEWLLDNAGQTGYNVTLDDGERHPTVFIDAEDIDR